MEAIDFSDVREMQSEGDSDIINRMTEMGCFFINPRGKLPPRLKKDNMGLVLAKSVISPGASVKDCEVDSSKRVIKIDHTQLRERYHWFIKWFSETFQARNNLTIYSIFLNQASNSSKFIHGINLPEVVEKWKGEWRQGEEKIEGETAEQTKKKADKRANKQLKNYIESMRNVLHIDEYLEIISAKLVEYKYIEKVDGQDVEKTIYKIHLHFKVDGQDSTIAFGYPTKRTIHDLGDGKLVWFINGIGNDFSPKGAEEIDRLFSSDEIREITAELEQRKAKGAINFFIWRAPEYVTRENYKFYHRYPIPEGMNDDDALKTCHGVLKCFPATEGEEGSTKNKKTGEWEIRVIVELVSDAHGSELWATQDQVLPDYGKRYGDKEEKEKFNYWKNVFFQDIKKSIDNGETVLRVDLAHSFFVEGEDRMLEELIRDAVSYADRKIYFLLETYNKDKSKIDTFREWNNNLPYPAVKVYHSQIEKNLLKLQDGDGPDNLMKDLNWLLQDLRGIFGEMAAIATYDDHSLAVVAERSGIPEEALLEMILLLGKAGFNAFLLDRDFKLLRGQICPMPGGDHDTHLFPDPEELRARKEDFENRYKKSRGAQILEEINSLGDIKGIDLDPDNKTLTFFFKCGTKKIFNFLALRDKCYEGRKVETIKGEGEKKKDNQLRRFKQRKKRTLGKKPNPWEDKIVDSIGDDVELASVYDTEFWNEFYHHIKTKAWNEKQIHDDDKWKQEAYFLLNRERLIKEFLEEKGLFIESPELEEDRSGFSPVLIDARDRFRERTDYILRQRVSGRYEDLAEAA